MSTPDTIQEAIEQMAMYIKSEINKLLNKIDA